MMTPPIKIIHVRQQTDYTCGAASFGMLFGISEAEAARLVRTDKSGTHVGDVMSCLRDKEIPHEIINLNKDFELVIPDLITVSLKFPVYVSGLFKDRKFSKGRCRERRHAFVLSDRLIYDPGEDREMTWESFRSVFNHSLTINSAIIIDIECPNFLKNSRENPLAA
jgi:hypothetical protein